MTSLCMGAVWAWIRANVGRHIRGIAPRLLAILLIAAGRAAAQEPVSLELLLAVDVSTSVNDIEFRHQVEGMAAAFSDAEVRELIRTRALGVAVEVTLWGGFPQSAIPLPWRVLRDDGDVDAFAGDLLRVRRDSLGYLTAIGHALRFAVRRIESNAYEGLEKKIDVAGDGKSNAGPEPRHESARALALGITVNGLVIGNAEAGLVAYYKRNVVAGPEAFVEYAADFDDFAEAFRRKLKRELAPKLAGKGNIRHARR